MSLPEQVRRQSEAVVQHYEELSRNADAAAQPSAGDAAPPAAPADGTQNAAPTPPAAEQKPGAPTSEETAEQRYRTLQGMYNADTARYRVNEQHLQSRVAQLESLISSLSSQSAPAAPAATSQEKLITDQDVAEYGESLDVMRRVTREETAAYQRRINELEQLVRQMQTNIVPRVEQVVQRQAVSAEQTFWSDLSSLVPEWQQINADQAFHSWLLEVDPLSGSNRQAHLEAAQRSLDARRVAEFFRSWRGQGGQVSAQPTRNEAVSELERQVQPGRTRSSGVPADKQGTTYSPKDISKFFDDVRRGVYRGREAERDRIERDIFAAQRENRIVATA
jgi:hypothetical protein